MNSTKQIVDEFLVQNFDKIEEERTCNKQFRWAIISNLLGVNLSSDYIRGRFRLIRRFKDTKVIEKDYQPKTLYIDIEIGYNIVWSWGLGNKVRLGPDNIIEERKILCISYSWLGSDKIETVSAFNGDEYKMLTKLAKLVEESDIVCGHNINSFDIKHIRTRCIYLGIPFPAFKASIDTLTLARKSFRFNSNKLDYLAKFLGVGEKVDTHGMTLWHRIVLHNDKEAMKEMSMYCENDIRILKLVHEKLKEFTPTYKFNNYKSKELNIIE